LQGVGGGKNWPTGKEFVNETNDKKIEETNRGKWGIEKKQKGHPGKVNRRGWKKKKLRCRWGAVGIQKKTLGRGKKKVTDRSKRPVVGGGNAKKDGENKVSGRNWQLCPQEKLGGGKGWEEGEENTIRTGFKKIRKGCNQGRNSNARKKPEVLKEKQRGTLRAKIKG